MSAFTATILSGGSPLDPAFRVVSIDVRREVNRIPQAELRLRDGSSVTREFKISNDSFFEPGAEIEIRLRYEGGSEQSVFKGLVVRHGVEASLEGSHLLIGLKDAAVKLAGARMSEVHRNESDAKTIRKLVQRAGLKVGDIPTSSSPEHVEMVQYRASAWDFIVSRADVLGRLVAVEDGVVSLPKMEVASSAAAKLEYGINNLYEIEIEADAGHQPGAVQSIGWNAKKGAQTLKKAAAVSTRAGNLKGDALGKALGSAVVTLSHPVPADENELQTWADSRMARSRLALLRGRISMPGTTAIKQMDVIQLAGVSDRFNGKALVTGVRHRVNAAGWRTDLQLGLSPEEYARRQDIREVPAAGLLPAVSGLQIGVVAEFQEDKKDKLRVKVNLPGIDMQQSSAVWARLLAPDAGKNRGYYFRPEPNDEVVVGFLNDDPRQPVILGALYGAINTPSALMKAPTADNAYRGIITKAGTKIVFVDDKKSSVYIETAKKGKLLLDDGSKDGEETISLTDKHGNAITMSKDGIEIKSKKKVVVNGASGVEIKGKKVDIK